MIRTWLLLPAVLFLASGLRGQGIEVGFRVTGVHLHKVMETPGGGGARVLLHLDDAVAIDLGVDYFPENPSGNFGQSMVGAGIRAGSTFGKFGVFARARPGVIHFGGAFYDLRMADRNHFLLDLGGAIEYYPSPRTVLRLDLGDTIIAYGDTRLFTRLDPDPLGIVHNFQPALGFGFRF